MGRAGGGGQGDIFSVRSRRHFHFISIFEIPVNLKERKEGNKEA